MTFTANQIITIQQGANSCLKFYHTRFVTSLLIGRLIWRSDKKSTID